MIWAKRRFQGAEYAPYMDRLDKLLMADVARTPHYVMVSVEAECGDHDYYISVPDEALMRFFDGFTRVSESELPKEIDAFHLGVEGEKFRRLFRFKHDKA